MKILMINDTLLYKVQICNTGSLSKDFARQAQYDMISGKTLDNFGSVARVRSGDMNVTHATTEIYNTHANWRFAIVVLACLCLHRDAFSVGQTQYVQSVAQKGSFPIAQRNRVTSIYYDATDWPGVVRAAGDLRSDISRVTGQTAAISSDPDRIAGNTIIVGTIGKSRIIDDLIHAGKIDVRQIAGKWESFFVQVVADPLPNVENGLVIVGSDKRGTIYGIYDLCEQMGVSPCYWWADVPIRHRNALFVKAGKYVQGPPSVKYRGIFINDESPDLSGWVREKFGTIPASSNPPIPPGVANYNSEFYARIFEAILRMKGNYLWPAMWNNAFNEDDPDNPKLADEYGIVMGTSHQEPMLRAQKEWDRRFQKTLGSWNYFKHPDILQDFWMQGIQRNKSFESIFTIGLRGENDTPMIPDATIAQSMALLEKIVSVQRKMIADEINPDVSKIPQLWCLYKEVLEYYNAGLRVPEDVTLLWPDDNWGNIRRLPTESERSRTGGAGIYYHFDYVGGPRNYKWINTVSLPTVWDQMSLAKEYGADRIWIVNVGHFKHVLLPAEFFLQLAWDTGRWTNRNIGEYTRLWAAREFGPQYAEDVAGIVDQYTKYNARRKPELLAPTTYALNDYQEADRIVADFRAIVTKAEEIYQKLPPEARDAFYDLVLFPAKACAQVNELYVAAGKNALYAQQGRAATNDLADRVQRLFDADAALMAYYNKNFAGGKWNHFMDQVHIGYTIWQDPQQNIMPRVTRIELPRVGAMGISLEGSSSVWPGASEDPLLPSFDALNRQRRYIDVFNRGKKSFAYTASAKESWIVLSSLNGTVAKEDRMWVTIDWDRVPKGTQRGTIRLAQSGGETVDIGILANRPSAVDRDTLDGFAEGAGYVSIEAEHFTKNLPAPQAQWGEIEGYGRTLSAMSILPGTARSVSPPNDSPCLEYKMYLFSPGRTSVLATFAPTLNFVPGRGLRYGVSFDNEAPQIITIVPRDFDARNGNREWEDCVRNASRTIRSTHELPKAGYHTLKIWMVDPGVVLEKIVVDLGGLKPSYLGPPESYHKVKKATD
jgi:hypothetical protein